MNVGVLRPQNSSIRISDGTRLLGCPRTARYIWGCPYPKEVRRMTIAIWQQSGNDVLVALCYNALWEQNKISTCRHV